MVMIRYGCWSLFLVAWMLAQVPSALRNPQFSVVIQPANPTVLPFESLALSVTVTNVSGVAATAECCGIGVWFLNGSGQWLSYYSDATPIPSMPVGRRVYQPGESTTRVTYVDIRYGGKHVFASPGDVRLKINVDSLEPQFVTVHVQEPTGQDKAMLAELRSSGLTNYLAVDASERYEITREKLQALAELKAKFSGSRYADHAAVALGTYYISDMGGHLDRPRAKHIFRELEAKSDTAPTAAYYLGVIAMQEGDTVTAQRYIESARKSSQDPLIQQRAKYRLDEIARKQKQ